MLHVKQCVEIFTQIKQLLSQASQLLVNILLNVPVRHVDIQVLFCNEYPFVHLRQKESLLQLMQGISHRIHLF